MHALAAAAPHLIPKVARHFQFCVTGIFTCVRARRSSNPASPATSCKRNQIICSRLACGEPREERIALAWPGLLELLEPSNEIVDARWNVCQKRIDFGPHGLDIFALGTMDRRVDVELLPPSVVGNSRPKLPAIVFREFSLKSFKAGP